MLIFYVKRFESSILGILRLLIKRTLADIIRIYHFPICPFAIGNVTIVFFAQSLFLHLECCTKSNVIAIHSHIEVHVDESRESLSSNILVELKLKARTQSYNPSPCRGIYFCHISLCPAGRELWEMHKMWNNKLCT